MLADIPIRLLPLAQEAAEDAEDTGLFADLDLWVRGVVAVGIIVVGMTAAAVLRKVLRPRLAALRTPSFGSVFSRLIGFAVSLAAWLFALVVLFPSVNVATMLGGLGILSIAAGFAFQDILSNLLAGILLIFRQPFVSGDQIEVNGLRGTVEEITIRETRVRTFDGRLVVIPNQDVYTNAIEVQTDHEAVRTSLVVGVGYDSNLSEVREVALAVLADVDGVLDDPEPQAYFIEFGASSMDLDLRYWTGSQQAEIRRVQDAVVEGIFDAFTEQGIDIPFQIVTIDN